MVPWASALGNPCGRAWSTDRAADGNGDVFLRRNAGNSSRVVALSARHGAISIVVTDGNKSLPILDMAYRLTLEINQEIKLFMRERQAVVELSRHQRPGLGRRLEEAAFDLLAALVKA